MSARSSVSCALILALIFGGAAPVLGQSVAFHYFTPAVLLPNASQPVLYEAEITGSPTRVAFEFSPGAPSTSPTFFEMRDDGTAGDRIAGDRIYAVQLPVSPILTAVRSDDVHRVFVGFLNLFSGTTNVFRGNILAPGAAPTRFCLGTILVSRDALVSPEMMWLYSWFVERAELETPTPTHSGFLKESGKPFYVATRGRAALDMHLSHTALDPGESDFSFTVAPGSLTVAAGSPAAFSLNATAGGTAFSSEVSFACGTLPAHAVCSFAPARVAAGSKSATVTLTITTRDTGISLAITGAPIVAAVLLCLVGTSRRAARLCATVVLMMAFVGSSGCGGGSSPQPPNTSTTVAPGTYPISVTATSGAAQRSVALTLVVQ